MVFTFASTTTGVTSTVVTQGLAAQDFADAGTGTCTTNTSSHSYTSGQTCTVDVTFHPKAVGNRFGAVLLKSGGNVIATGYTSGIGVAGQATFSPATQLNVSSGFSNPQGLVIDGNGKLFVADTANNQVVKGTGVGGGYSQVVVDSAVSQPYAVAVDGAGNLYVADHSNNRIKKETWNGEHLHRQPITLRRPQSAGWSGRRCRGQRIHRRHRQQSRVEGDPGRRRLYAKPCGYRVEQPG